MNDVYSRTYMLSITPMGISLVGVEDIDSKFNMLTSFEVNIDVQNNFGSSLEFFSRKLMNKIGKEIGNKILTGELHNGDFIKLVPLMENGEAMIKISVFRDNIISKDVIKHLRKSIDNIPHTISEKKKEIDFLRNKLNNAIDNKNYYECLEIVKKINYLKDEFLI